MDLPGRRQFLTFRLYDSVPAELIERWKRHLNWRAALPPSDPITLELHRRIEAYADEGHGACFLREPRIAALVARALKHFDGERYELLEWSIMPNHVHVRIEPRSGFALETIVHSWKSFTATEANRLLGRRGAFWMRESFDRYIRDADHLRRVRKYILNQGPAVVAQSG